MRNIESDLKMGTIESFLTHSSPLVRQLIKELLKLGYQNVEIEPKKPPRVGSFIIDMKFAGIKFGINNAPRIHAVTFYEFARKWWFPMQGPNDLIYVLAIIKEYKKKNRRMIETLLTNSNPFVRQLIKGLIEQGHENMEIRKTRRVGCMVEKNKLSREEVGFKIRADC